MDHVWNSLKEWERIWLDRIESEKEKPDYEGKNIELRHLQKDVEAIQKAMSEIHKRF